MPSELHAHLGYWLRAVSNAVSQGFARAVEAEGVTVAEWVVVRTLYDVESIAPTQLAQRIGMTKSVISKLADRLVAKKLIARLADPRDRRAQSLALQPAGRALVPKLAELADRNDAAFFGTLASDERCQLEGLLRSIVAERGLNCAPTD